MEVFLEELCPPYITSSTLLPSLLTVGMAGLHQSLKRFESPFLQPDL